ncbi:MAG TPA: ferredoxin family protein [Chloroflexi bacterium]|nr:ferredoxin family protein [Anaerolineaceae bacterium]HHX07940.1 ferredoxin family protein [Chloroflexota bacterium]
MALSYRMINIDNVPAGLLGLEELFARLFQDGVRPDGPETGDLLIKGVKEHNFVPKSSINSYREVLSQEYKRYFQKRASGKAIVARDYGTWRGYPREQIPWFPTISRDLCTDCGACLELCAREVYEIDDQGHVWVAEPFLCMVGCCFCKSVCEPKAILMPKQDILNNYRQKN